MRKIHWAHEGMKDVCGRIGRSYSNYRKHVTCLACLKAIKKGKRPNKSIQPTPKAGG